MYSERTPPGTPPCKTCRVELSAENEDVANVFIMTRDQVITAAMGEVIDISIPAIKTVMDLFGVKDQKGCLLRVIRVFHHFLAKKNKGELCE
jgi:hypothetical protein